MKIRTKIEYELNISKTMLEIIDKEIEIINKQIKETGTSNEMIDIYYTLHYKYAEQVRFLEDLLTYDY